MPGNCTIASREAHRTGLDAEHQQQQVRAELHQRPPGHAPAHVSTASNTDLYSCTVVFLLYLWVRWLIRVDIGLRTGNGFRQALTQQQRDQCHWANGLQRPTALCHIQAATQMFDVNQPSPIWVTSMTSASQRDDMYTCYVCYPAAWLMWMDVVDGTSRHKLLY